MTISMILLIGFEGMWLNQNYRAQKAHLEHEINEQFRSAVLERQDSLITRLILIPLLESLPDSVKDVDLRGVRRWSGSQERNRNYFLARKDSFSMSRDQHPEQQVKFKVVKPDPDQTISALKKRMIRLIYSSGGSEGQDLDFISSSEDSLRLLEIDTVFRAQLAQLDMQVPYQIFRAEKDSNYFSKKGFLTAGVRGDIPSRTVYKAQVLDTKPWLFRKMLPLFLFTLFLTLITGISFALVYRSLKQQQRLTDMKNSFISNVTHELQTPITSVGVALEALSNFDVLTNKEKTEEYLEISKSELNRLSILVDKVLKMALFEENDLRLHLEPLDLKQLLEKILNSMRLQFEQKQATIKQVYTGSAFTIIADRVHLTSVIYNLLDNALKYSKSEAQIDVSLTTTTEGVQLDIKDQGIGIPSIYQGKIFDKFFRVPTGDLHQIKGHGLGLSYVATIVEKLNAKVKVESTPNQGSTFTLHFTPISEPVLN